MQDATTLLRQIAVLKAENPFLFNNYGGAKAPRLPSWQRNRVSLYRLSLELPLYWHVSQDERNGFVGAIKDTEVYNETLPDSPDKKPSVEYITASAYAARTAHALLRRDIGEEVARKFYIAHLDILNCQYSTFTQSEPDRNDRLSHLHRKMLRFGLKTYFADQEARGLPSKEIRVFAQSLSSYLDIAQSRNASELGFEFGSWMEARTKLLFGAGCGLDKITWGQMSQALAVLSESWVKPVLSDGAIDKIGRALHYMWGMPVNLGSDAPKNPFLEVAKQAGLEQEVKRALLSFRKALSVTQFKTTYGDTNATREVFGLK
jgi:hypothetical protein